MAAWVPSTRTGFQSTSLASEFIPELWSDEVLGAYKANLVLANLVTKINHQGKYGDTIHIPVTGRSDAAAYSFTGTGAVTLQSDQSYKKSVLIDRHFEWSMLIDDVTMIQSLDSMRRFYTDDAGYALAKMVDWHLHVLATGWNGGTVDTTGVDTPGGDLTYGTGTVIGGDGTTAWDATGTGNGSVLTDVGIRAMIQFLDDKDIPLSDRALVIPPVTKNNLLGLSRFTEQAFVGEAGAGNSIRNGLVGDVYGIPVYVSTNCGYVSGVTSGNNYRAGLMFHKSAMCYAEQMAVRTQTQYKQEFLADLFTADVLYGVLNLRDGAANMPAAAGLAFIVPQ